MTDSVHDWDGAYVLGALSPEDRRRYEEHLADCSTCARAVQDLAGIPGILGTLDPDEALALRDLPDDPLLREAEHVPDRAAGVARRVRRRRRRARLTGAIVLVAVLLAGSVGGWSIVRALQPVATPLAVAHVLDPVGDSQLSADLTVTPVGWGTRLDWSCSYGARAGGGSSYTPVSYSLVVHTRTGTSSTVATWTSDEGEASGLVASTAIPADAIASVDIRVTGTGTALARTSF
jgi:hypothetical protein